MQQNKRKKPINFTITDTNCFEVNDRAKGERYPKILYHGRNTGIHRFIYEECFGFIPDGLLVRHKCDNTRCCNPEHLELGTQKDNMRDMSERNPNVKGSKHHNSKLNEEQVYEIKKLIFKNEVSFRSIARDFQTSVGTIIDIAYGKIWKHVEFEGKISLNEKRSSPVYRDLTGREFGSWIVLEFDKKNDRGKLFWTCQCVCGQIKSVVGHSLKSGQSKSCGCARDKDK